MGIEPGVIGGESTEVLLIFQATAADLRDQPIEERLHIHDLDKVATESYEYFGRAVGDAKEIEEATDLQELRGSPIVDTVLGWVGYVARVEGVTLDEAVPTLVVYDDHHNTP